MLANQNVWDDIFVFMDKKYPDRWELQAGHGIVVHYPEILMKNTAGKEHLITDLFISLPVNVISDNFRVLTGSFKGMRMSASKAELNDRYVHSHLSSSVIEDYHTFSSFCRGYGPITWHLTKCTTASFMITDFKLLMYNVDTYVAYESTNTNPYKRFEGISGFIKAAKIRKIYPDELTNLVSAIIHPEKIKVKVKKDGVSLVRPEKLNEVFGPNLQSVVLRRLLVSKSADGIYYVLGSSSSSRISEENIQANTFPFRGEVVQFKVTKNTVEREVVLHPHVVLELKKYIENEFNYKTWMDRFLHSEKG